MRKLWGVNLSKYFPLRCFLHYFTHLFYRKKNQKGNKLIIIKFLTFVTPGEHSAKKKKKKKNCLCDNPVRNPNKAIGSLRCHNSLSTEQYRLVDKGEGGKKKKLGKVYWHAARKGRRLKRPRAMGVTIAQVSVWTQNRGEVEKKSTNIHLKRESFFLMGKE